MLSTAIGYLVIGLCSGLLVRLLMPDPPWTGWLASILVGIVGAVAGGSLTNLVVADGPLALTSTGLYGSVLGAMALQGAWRAALERTRAA